MLNILSHGARSIHGQILVRIEIIRFINSFYRKNQITPYIIHNYISIHFRVVDLI